MIVPRRIVISLTPLLDMLLIVIFAQYLDIKGKSERSVARLEHASASALDQERELRSQAQQARDYAVTLRKETEKQLKAQTKTIEDLRLETDKLRVELQEAKSAAEVRMRQTQRDLEAAAEALSEILRLPKEAFEPTLQELPIEERTSVRRELEDIRGKGIQKVIEHLRKLSALKKRCDFWEVFIADDDTISVRSNELEFGPFSAGSEDQFIVEMKNIAGKMPEPKSLVILLLSYGDAQRGTRRNVENGLRNLCDTYLKAKYDNKKRFELAILGYTVDAP